MSRKDIEWIEAETRRLEAMGVVLGMLGLSTFQCKPAGRPRKHRNKTERQQAYRKRKAEKPLTTIKDGRKKWLLEKVADLPIGKKMEGGSI